MYDYKKDIETVKDPGNIRDVYYASSPYVLKKAFENDLTVRRLINAGKEVVPFIAEEIRKNAEIPEISLACFAYILQKVDLRSAKQLLKPLFVQATEKPGPFFVHFAAHAMRQSVKLPVSPEKMTFTKDELLETLEALEPKEPKSRKEKEEQNA